MQRKENNFAYIDGANLHKGVKGLGWNLDYRRFRVWLREKYFIEQAYIFIGLVPRSILGVKKEKTPDKDKTL
ncbi:MAG: Uncharacterized protein Athens071412_148 [Parcubacteria group bacterium Athens0714_12]|nr:MAG: Uncharacterized protein Athens071412_148 [Parcubacteria group bacterium Athens0714_12]